MKNLDQIRAANAIDAAGKIGKGENDGEVVKKVPTMIMENGILAAAAFANEKEKGYKDVFVAGIIPHLADPAIAKLHGDNKDLQGFIKDMTETSSDTLRAVTSEAIAYLNFLRRFAKK